MLFQAKYLYYIVFLPFFFYAPPWVAETGIFPILNVVHLLAWSFFCFYAGFYQFLHDPDIVTELALPAPDSSFHKFLSKPIFARLSEFSLDIRSLALCRVGIAITIFGDLFFTRLAHFSSFYTNEGFPSGSFFLQGETFMKGQPSASIFLAFLLLLATFNLLLGFRTSSSSYVLVWAHYTLGARIENWGRGDDCWANVFLVSLLLPLSETFSIDSCLSPRPGAPQRSLLRFSPSVVVLFLQILLLYQGSGIYKTGSWHSGEAIYYSLKNRGWVSSFGIWFGEVTPFLFQYLANFAILFWENVGWILIFSLWNRERCLYVAIVGFLIMHFSFGVMMPSIQGFVWFPLPLLLALLPSSFWTYLSSRRKITGGKVKITVRESRISFFVHLFHLLTFYSPRYSLSVRLPEHSSPSLLSIKHKQNHEQNLHNDRDAIHFLVKQIPLLPFKNQLSDALYFALYFSPSPFSASSDRWAPFLRFCFQFIKGGLLVLFVGYSAKIYWTDLGIAKQIYTGTPTNGIFFPLYPYRWTTQFGMFRNPGSFDEWFYWQIVGTIWEDGELKTDTVDLWSGARPPQNPLTWIPSPSFFDYNGGMRFAGTWRNTCQPKRREVWACRFYASQYNISSLSIVEVRQTWGRNKRGIPPLVTRGPSYNCQDLPNLKIKPCSGTILEVLPDPPRPDWWETHGTPFHRFQESSSLEETSSQDFEGEYFQEGESSEPDW